MPGTFLPYPISTVLQGAYPPSSPSSKVPSWTYSRSTPTGSTPSFSTGDDDLSSEHDWDVWDVVDSVYSRRSSVPPEKNGGKQLSQDLIFALDGETFGADRHHGGVDRSTNRKPLKFPRPPGGLEMDIPHFPELTEALLGPPGQRKNGVRTSEPISVGVMPKSEQEMLGHVTRQRFQTLLDSQVGLARFRDWVDSEGYWGSKALFRYSQDAAAHVSLLEEISVVTEMMEGLYFGAAATSSSWANQLLATRPAHCLYALDSASLGMLSAQSEAFDKLYAAEFKRFIAGNSSAHARFCMEHYDSWHDRGDLGDVFCLADPNLPDQPLVMVSDGFCRLSEYPRETLIGRNCRFLQGPATDPEAVRLLREAIPGGQEHCSMLLNYTRTGKAFWNLFNMIPLRNRDGRIDYFLGAQVDCSRALTSPATFQALTGIAEGDPRIPARDASNKFAYSQELLETIDGHPDHPTLLRKIAPVSQESSAHADKPPRYFRTDANGLSGNGRKQSLGIRSLPAKDPLDPIPIPQEVPNPVRNHIVLKLVTARTPSESDATRQMIRQVVTDRLSHSMFVELASARSPKMSSIPETTSNDAPGQNGNSEDMVRSLMHLTPLGTTGTVSMYVAVVG